MSENAYGPEDTSPPNYAPKWKVENGTLFQDGVRIEKWQLTPEELAKWFPEEAYSGVLQQNMPCPFKDCKFIIMVNDGRSFIQHAKGIHGDWYVANRKNLDVSQEWPDILRWVRGFDNANTGQ